MPIPRVAIIGGGPGGLTLASIFSAHQPSIPYTIFELRSPPSPISNPTPSGSLDLHAESGLLALAQCNLIHQFETLQRSCSEDTIIANKAGDVCYRDDGMGGDRPEISRNDLTRLLLNSVPAENVKWEHKLLSITSHNSPSAPKWTLRFATSENEREEIFQFDFIIGADGAWSRVRALLSETKPHFSSVSCITLTIPNITKTQLNLAEIIGGGSYYAAGEKKAIIAQRGSLESARMYVMLRSEHDTFLETSGLAAAAKSPSTLKTRLLDDKEFFGSWGKGIRELIAAGCDAELEAGNEVSAVPLSMLPLGFSWSHVPGVTIIGDAAHLMTPFAGEGVNNAMLDALELARAFFAAFESDYEKKGIDEAVREFEMGMWERSKEVGTETWENLQVIFADDAPDGFVKVMESHGPPPSEEDAH